MTTVRSFGGIFCLAAFMAAIAVAADKSGSQPASELTDAEFASLQSHLANADKNVRQNAITELGETSDPRSIKLLLTLAENSPTKSLGIKTADSGEYLYAKGTSQQATEESLAALKILAKHPAKDQIVPRLSTFLATQVSARLGRLQRADAAEMGGSSHQSEYAADVANALGDSGDERAVDSLATVLKTTFVPRIQAARVRKIKMVVMGGDSQAAAARALGKIKGKKSADALVAVLTTPPSPYSPLDVVGEALAKSNNTNAIKPLVTSIGGMKIVPKPPLDEEFLKRRAAIATALKGLTGQDLGEDTEAWTTWLRNNPVDATAVATTVPSTPTQKLTANEVEQRLIKQRRFNYKFAADAPRLMELLPDGKFGVGPGGGKVGGSPDSFEQRWKATDDGIIISGSHGDFALHMEASGTLRGRINDLGFDVTLTPK